MNNYKTYNSYSQCIYWPEWSCETGENTEFSWLAKISFGKKQNKKRKHLKSVLSKSRFKYAEKLISLLLKILGIFCEH